MQNRSEYLKRDRGSSKLGFPKPRLNERDKNSTKKKVWYNSVFLPGGLFCHKQHGAWESPQQLKHWRNPPSHSLEYYNAYLITPEPRHLSPYNMETTNITQELPI